MRCRPRVLHAPDWVLRPDRETLGVEILIVDVAALEPGAVRQFHPGRVRQVVSEELTEKRGERHQVRMLKVQPAGMYLRGDFSRARQLRTGQGDAVFVLWRQESHVRLQGSAPGRVQRVVAPTGVRSETDVRLLAVGHQPQEAG